MKYLLIGFILLATTVQADIGSPKESLTRWDLELLTVYELWQDALGAKPYDYQEKTQTVESEFTQTKWADALDQADKMWNDCPYDFESPTKAKKQDEEEQIKKEVWETINW